MSLKRACIAMLAAFIVSAAVIAASASTAMAAVLAAPTVSCSGTAAAGGTVEMSADYTIGDGAEPSASLTLHLDTKGLVGAQPAAKVLNASGDDITATAGNFSWSGSVLTYTINGDYIDDMADDPDALRLRIEVESASLLDDYVSLARKGTLNGATYTLPAMEAYAICDGDKSDVGVAGTALKLPAPSLTFDKTVDHKITNVGAPVKYTLTVTMTNDAQVFGMSITDRLNNTSKLTDSTIAEGVEIYRNSVADGNKCTSDYSVKCNNGVLTITPHDPYKVQIASSSGKLIVVYTNTYDNFDLVGGLTFNNTFSVSGGSADTASGQGSASVEVGVPVFKPSIEWDEGTPSAVNAGDTVHGTAVVVVDAEDTIVTDNLVVNVSIKGDDAVAAAGVKLTPDASVAATSKDDLSFTKNVSSTGATTLRFGFTITIPEGGTLNGLPISATVLATADNAASAQSSGSIKVSDPKVDVAVSTTQPPVSAESVVKVSTEINETVAGANAQKVVARITDDGASHGATVFDSATAFKKNGGEPVDATITAEGDTLTVSFNGDLVFNEPVVVEYNDILGAGYENNGANITAKASVTSAEGGNLNGAKEASATYAINAPALTVVQDVVMPVISVDPDTGEVSDGEGDDGTGDGGATVPGEEGGEQADVSDPSTQASGGADSGDGTVVGGGEGEGTVDVDTGKLPDDSGDGALATQLVINPGDTADFTVAMSQTDANAIARDATLKVAIDKASAEAGATIDADSVKVSNGAGEDVSASFTVAVAEDGSSMLISGSDDATLDWTGQTAYSVAYTVKAGETDSVGLRGKTLTMSATLSASNVAPEDVATDDDSVMIASSVLEITKSMDITEIMPGDEVGYVITVKNTGEMENSEAMNVVVNDILSQTAYDTGYRMDATSFTVKGPDGKDATEAADMKWNTPSNVTIDTNLSLKSGEELVIEYKATTADIPADAYSANIFNTAVANADNATYQVAIASGMYIGADLVDPALLEGGSIDPGMDGTALSRTGDAVMWIAIGVAVVAGLGIVGALVWRRRKNSGK